MNNVAMNDHSMDFEYCLARQPICDRNLKLTGYELLYRPHSQATQAGFPDPEQATAQVLMTTLIEAGIDSLTGDVLGYINMTREALLSAEQLDLPRDRVVYEILEDVEVDEKLLEAVERLVNRGYQIALDDFTYSDAGLALIELAHIVKLDVMALDAESLNKHVTLLKNYPVKLLAEKVETWEEFRRCRELGFDLFQGYFFASPQLLNGKKAPHHRFSTMKLLSRLNNPQVELQELENLIARDPFIYYKLLRYINSAHLGLKREFSNIRQIIIFLGLDQLRSLVSMMALTKMTDKPTLLFASILQRAKLCELLSQEMNLPKSSQGEFFMVGLFSMLDACLDLPLEELFKDMPLPPSIKNAILNREGPAGLALTCASRIERLQCYKCSGCISSEPLVHSHYIQALKWADDVVRENV